MVINCYKLSNLSPIPTAVSDKSGDTKKNFRKKTNLETILSSPQNITYRREENVSVINLGRNLCAF
jgi:hypothetical protein